MSNNESTNKPSENEQLNKTDSNDSKPEKTAAAKVEQPKNEQPPAQDVPKKEEKTELKKEAAAKPAVKKIEKPANCPACNKPMKDKWYYRNNNYYCGKGCFKQAEKKKKDADKESKPKAGDSASK